MNLFMGDVLGELKVDTGFPLGKLEQDISFYQVAVSSPAEGKDYVAQSLKLLPAQEITNTHIPAATGILLPWRENNS